MKTRVLVVGGGFAGTAAVAALAKHSAAFQVTLADPRKTFDFLPMLPDILGRGIPVQLLAADLHGFCARHRALYVNEAARSIDLSRNEASLGTQVVSFDYAVIASGTETNFYGNDAIARSAYKLDDTQDALRLAGAVRSGAHRMYLVAGGGYTGVEVATNIRRQLNSLGRKDRVVIIERQSAMLGPMPEWMRTFVAGHLASMGIEVWCSSGIDKIENESTWVTGHGVMKDALVVWAAGVKTVNVVQSLPFEKSPQGRIRVDEHLLAHERCFVAGDAAWVIHKGQPLRMGVQFSVAQGELVAANLVRIVAKRQMLPFKPVDLGYIIPLANDRACGMVLGARLKGIIPMLLHYGVCIFRSVGLKRQAGIIVVLLQGGGVMVDLALLVLRVGLGVMFIAHGMQMALGLFAGPGIEGFAKLCATLGFAPAHLWAYLAGYTTLLGGVLVLTGAFTRIASASLLIFIAVAGIKVHLSKGFFLQNGGFEYTFIIACMCLALIIAGPGKYSLYKKG